MIRKAYFCDDLNKYGHGGSRFIFCEMPEFAWDFTSREHAMTIRDSWNLGGIKMHTERGIVTTQNFEIEEWQGKFLLACHGPFLNAEHQRS